MGLAVLAFLLRRRRERASLDLASASLGVALVLLIATPSKWPWHFGALVGVAAVAVAAETVRLRKDASEAHGWNARPFVVIGAALLALVWASGKRLPWNPDDLRSLDWALSLSWFQAETIAAGFALMFAAAILLAHHRARPLATSAWELATRAALVITLPLIAFTVGMLAVDAAKTDGWTLTRQNLQSLRGAPGCGFGDDLLVPDMDSVRPISILGGAKGRVPASLPCAYGRENRPLALGPWPEDGSRLPGMR